MANRLYDIWTANRRLYGAEKLWTAALEADVSIGRDQVARLMGILGIEGVRRGKHKTVTTTSDPKAARHPDLIKRNWGGPTRPDQWWVADFTYVWTLTGFVYVSFVTDVFSRRILGWRVSTSKTTSLVLSALEQALFTRRRHNSRFTSTGLVHHSDAGSQYTSITFGEALIDAGISPSIGTVGDALDNALQESTIGLYKTELIEHERTTSWTEAAEVERETASYLHWFNQSRIHLSIGRMSPVRYEALWAATEPARTA
jgi:transposase InsO family protein